MIEWKVWNGNGVDFNKEYLICIDNKYVKVGEYWDLDDSGYWVETQEMIRQENVTHYAEINLPKASESTEVHPVE